MVIDAEDSAALDGLRTKLITSIGTANIPAIVAMHVDNAVVLAPGRDIIRGADVQRFWRNVAQQLRNLNFTTTDLEPLGTDAALETGTLSFEVGSEKSGQVVCKYLFIWKKETEEWKLAAVAWNRLA
jgi:ketosteroid isomerase-like protein